MEDASANCPVRKLGFILFNDRKEVFVIQEKRNKPDKKIGMISVPIVTIINGESYGQALDRLLVKETGVSRHEIEFRGFSGPMDISSEGGGVKIIFGHGLFLGSATKSFFYNSDYTVGFFDWMKLGQIDKWPTRVEMPSVLKYFSDENRCLFP